MTDRPAIPDHSVRKRSVAIHGHRTSLSLEGAFWEALTHIAGLRGLAISALVSEIDDQRDPDGNLSSALRLHVLEWLKAGNRL
jgi:predicted DNA-binding ribbon-helix-helix protein